MIRPVEILLVEDNPADVRLTREALREARILCQLAVAGDGAETLDRLRGRGRWAGTRHPDLCLLDLKLPRKGGLEILAEAKADPDLKSIPMVILTGSSNETDILQAYELRANGYFIKPLDPQRLLAIVRSLPDFWVAIVHMPEVSSP